MFPQADWLISSKMPPIGDRRNRTFNLEYTSDEMGPVEFHNSNLGFPF